MINETMNSATSAYVLYRIAEKNTPDGLMLERAPVPTPDSPKFPTTAANQLETGIKIHTGAAVESMIYASFALEILNLSVIGFITVPTVRQLK